MKKLLQVTLFCCSLLACNISVASTSVWEPIQKSDAPSVQLMPFQPSDYRVLKLQSAALRLRLFSLGNTRETAAVMSLPMPDGTYMDFFVWEESMMEAPLAARYPEIKTFSAVAVSDSRVTAKLDYTLYGFHAVIFNGEKTSFIDPYDNNNDGYYFVHYKNAEIRSIEQRMKCEVRGRNDESPAGESMEWTGSGLPKLAKRTANGWHLRTYRLALSANNFYCRAATGLSAPTIAQSLSKMTTTMNRVNGLYERELSVHMNFVANEDTLIWNAATGGPNGTDPFNSINTNGAACMGVNQTQCDARIGRANYDVGHVFTTGAGGISNLGNVCVHVNKARSCTGSPSPIGDGFDVDYVAHEIGHEFGSEHTFNNDLDGSCGGNAVSNYAFEPGSGASIMDYAGICSPDNLQNNSDAYFSISSLQQINGFLNSTAGDCPVSTLTGNKLVTLTPFTASYSIPYKTPFELTGPTAVDSVADTATTYCWAQYNLGDFGKRVVSTFRRGPIFRSYYPVYKPTRIFPKASMVLAGNLSNAGTDGNQGEKAPDTARFLTFKMTVRNILAGKGCFLIPDDTIHIDAIATTTKRGFKVTSQGTTGVTYAGGSSQNVTWDVVGSNAAPVSCATIDVYMSLNSGLDWPYFVGNFPNTGSAMVTVPNPATSTGLCRFKVKGSGNIFFNVNARNFTVTNNAALPVTPVGTPLHTYSASSIRIYPVPATTSLHIEAPNTQHLTATISNTLGQKVWGATFDNTTEIPVSDWAKGIYFIRLQGAGIFETRSVVVE